MQLDPKVNTEYSLSYSVETLVIRWLQIVRCQEITWRAGELLDLQAANLQPANHHSNASSLPTQQLSIFPITGVSSEPALGILFLIQQSADL